MRRGRWAIWAAVVATLIARPARGQQLEVEGAVDDPAASAVRAIVARGDFQLLDRDTILPASYERKGDLIVVGATVRLEGTVEGDVGVVNGTLFVRPGGRIVGRTASIGGYVLPSGRATIGPIAALPLDVGVDLSRRGGGYLLRLTPPPPPPWFSLRGFRGLLLPTYDRVDGISPRVGVTIRPHPTTPGLQARGSVVYHSARGTLGGTGGIQAPLGGRGVITAEGGRETRTNEGWIRGDLSNTLAALWARSDARDYYSSTFGLVTLGLRPPPPLIAGEGAIVPWVRFLFSRDRSLRTRHVWTVFGRGTAWRGNPMIDEGDVASVTAGAQARWRGSATRFSGELSAEWGRLSPREPLPRRNFGLLTVDARWRMRALWGHSISVRAHVLQPLGSDLVPAQRWSFVGGPGTLPTLDYGELRGDHLVFVQSAYSIPLRPLAVPLLGAPAITIRDAIGSAWTSGAPSPRWTQNIGAGLEFSVFSIFVDADPAASRLHGVVSGALSFP